MSCTWKSDNGVVGWVLPDGRTRHVADCVESPGAMEQYRAQLCDVVALHQTHEIWLRIPTYAPAGDAERYSRRYVGISFSEIVHWTETRPIDLAFEWLDAGSAPVIEKAFHEERVGKVRTREQQDCYGLRGHNGPTSFQVGEPGWLWWHAWILNDRARRYREDVLRTARYLACLRLAGSWESAGGEHITFDAFCARLAAGGAP